MNREMPQRPRIVESQKEIEELLAASRVEFQDRIVQPIQDALEVLSEYAFTRILVPGVPHIVMSERAVEILFNALHRRVSASQHEGILRETGEEIGLSFADRFMEFLMTENAIPRTMEALLNIWAAYDSSANWGKFVVASVDEDGLEIRLEVEKNFLRRGLGPEDHRHCAFLAEYLAAFIWEAYKEHYRWFKRAIAEPRRLLEPSSVQEKPREDRCVFVVALRDEELSEAFDKLSDAKIACRLGDLGTACGRLRTALEFAAKSKLHVDGRQPISFTSIIKALRQQNVRLEGVDYSELLDIFQSSSRVIHGDVAPDSRACAVLLLRATKILRRMELAPIGEAKRETVREALDA